MVLQHRLYGPHGSDANARSCSRAKRSFATKVGIHCLLPEEICHKEVVYNRLAPLHIPGRAIGLARLDGLAGLLDLLEDCFVGEGVFGDNVGGLGFERDVVRLDACFGSVATPSSEMRRKALTVKLLEHALNGTGAATAAHGDVELVVVFGHGVERV